MPTPLRRVTATPAQGGAHNTVQNMTVLGSVAQGDSFTLEFLASTPDAQTTAAIVADADPKITAAQIQSALEDLDNIEVGDVQVTGVDNGPWTIEFMGKYAFQSIEVLVASLTGLTGGVMSVTTDGYDRSNVGSRNSKQRVWCTGTGTSFVLRAFNGTTDAADTAAIAQGASAATVKTRLTDLDLFDTTDISVTGTGTATNPWIIEFKGKYAGQAVPLLVRKTDVGGDLVSHVAQEVAGGGAEGNTVDVTGSQFIVFIVSKAPDGAAGVIQFEGAPDGVQFSELTVTRVSDAADVTETDVGEVGESFYVQTPAGPFSVRASYEGTTFTSEAPIVTVLAFG